MAAETTPCDAEIDDAARLIGAAIWRPQPCMSGNIWDRLGPLRERDCKRAALEVLLAARREADARVAAAVMGATKIVDFYIGHTAVAHEITRDVRALSDGTPTLATLLAEAREQGRREMREMAATACDAEMAHWCGPGYEAADQCRNAIRALPVTIPTPEAPQ